MVEPWLQRTATMSSTITTATLSAPPLLIQDVAAVLSPSERALLINSISQGSRPPTRPLASVSSEPPAKRIRRDENPRPTDPLLDHCLRTQVFPHIDRQLAILSPDRSNTLGIGRSSRFLSDLNLPASTTAAGTEPSAASLRSSWHIRLPDMCILLPVALILS
ncbi:hypothetical protein N657DRAFT_96224 [Parathielavia appendiculata]|uniref:Uncharacterized protein n=1 Tax=Parathielavia appendiculata TaxID=2587402 RepID=A0AAN6TW07_9PEZI|nr:hypothetical protein N657DRAFT_96224 [Parathielavia appendiculata]